MSLDTKYRYVRLFDRIREPVPVQSTFLLLVGVVKLRAR